MNETIPYLPGFLTQTERLSMRYQETGQYARIAGANTFGAAFWLCVALTLIAPTPASAHDCVITDWAVTHEVLDRKPQGRTSRFTEKVGHVSAFVTLNCSRVSGPAVFRFERDNKPYATISTKLSAANRWRTWASVRALPGNWRVTLEIEGGIVLEDEFFVSR